MRRYLATLIVPAICLGLLTLARVQMEDFGDGDWGPWDFEWTVWWIATVVVSLFLGAGLGILWSPYWNARRDPAERRIRRIRALRKRVARSRGSRFSDPEPPTGL